jgi:hypothetical protein
MATGTLTLNGQTHTDPQGCYNTDGDSADITYDLRGTVTVYSESDGQGNVVASFGGGQGSTSISPAGSVVVS